MSLVMFLTNICRHPLVIVFFKFLHSTGVQWATLHPTWDATWTLLGVPEGSMLLIFVKDKNKMMADSLLGSCSLILDSKLEGVREHTLEVQRPSERKQGEIYVQVKKSQLLSLVFFQSFKYRNELLYIIDGFLTHCFMYCRLRP